MHSVFEAHAEQQFAGAETFLVRVTFCLALMVEPWTHDGSFGEQAGSATAALTHSNANINAAISSIRDFG